MLWKLFLLSVCLCQCSARYAGDLDLEALLKDLAEPVAGSKDERSNEHLKDLLKELARERSLAEPRAPTEYKETGDNDADTAVRDIQSEDDAVQISSSVVLNGPDVTRASDFPDTANEPSGFPDGDEELFAEGDLPMPDNAGLDLRKVVYGNDKTWPDNVVPYTIGDSYDNKNHALILVQAAFDHWSKHTCIEPLLTNSPGEHPNFIEFRNGGSCASYVGFHRGGPKPQPIFLNEQYCLVFGKIVHEIGHALGFYHEHTRYDRSRYVDIMMERVQQGHQVDFNQQSSKTLGVPYDLASIMHYGKNFFLTHGSENIKVKDPNLQFLIGNQARLSYYDKKTANKMLNCDDGCAPIDCQHDGYVNKMCQCQCPDMLSGSNCQEINPLWNTAGCNGAVTTLEDGETFVVKSPGYPSTHKHGKCAWVFKGANENTKLSLKVVTIGVAGEGHSCYHSVEVRYNLLGQRGPSFCGTNSDSPMQLTSFFSNVAILLHADNTLFKTGKFHISITAEGETAAACQNNHCSPGTQVCVADPQDGGYECECADGFSGENCDVVEEVTCDFDDYYAALPFCVFTQSPSSDLDWQLGESEVYPQGTGPSNDVSGSGQYLYMLGNSGSPDDVAVLDSLEIAPGKKCLTFSYCMYGMYMGSLKVTASSATTSGSWEKSGNQGTGWRTAAIEVTSAKPFTIHFTAVRGPEYLSDVAIDAVTFASDECSNKDQSITLDLCSSHMCFIEGTLKSFFDVYEDGNQGFNIFYNVGSDDLDWIRRKGKTPSGGTGPDAGVFGYGRYLYVEASGASEGDTAVLTTPLLQAGYYCASMYVSMYGKKMGSLEISFQDEHSRQAIFTVTGDQGPDWQKVQFAIETTEFFKITIKVTRGSGFKSDVAIDRFKIGEADCDLRVVKNLIILSPHGRSNYESHTLVFG